MVSEKVRTPNEGEKRKPPRKPVILRIYRNFKRHQNRAKAKKQKTETDHQRNERTMAEWTRHVGRFTAALVATAIIGNLIIWMQLREMKSSGEDTKQLIKAAQDSAKAAQDAVKLAEDTAKRQLRAYVFADAFEMDYSDKKIVITAKFKNTGQTPAFDATANGLLSVEKDGAILRQSPIINKKDSGSYGRDSVILVRAEFNITDDFASDFKDGKITIRFKGNASYVDVFEETHFLSFNFRVRPFANGRTLMMPDDEGKDNQ